MANGQRARSIERDAAFPCLAQASITAAAASPGRGCSVRRIIRSEGIGVDPRDVPSPARDLSPMWKSSVVAAEMSLDKSGSFSLVQITEHSDIGRTPISPRPGNKTEPCPILLYEQYRSQTKQDMKMTRIMLALSTAIVVSSSVAASADDATPRTVRVEQGPTVTSSQALRMATADAKWEAVHQSGGW